MEGSERHGQKMGRVKKYSKGLLITIGIYAAFVLGISGFFAIKAIIEAPRDLGPDLVYIGQYGNLQNNPIPFFLFPDSAPWVDYFFGTNMSIDKVCQSITKAGFTLEGDCTDDYNGGSDIVLTFKPNEYSPEGLYITYYDAKDPTFYENDSNFNYIRTNKKHVLEMPDHNYRELRNAMQSANLLGK